MFTPDDVITQFIETKDVTKLAIRVPPQQPFGDNVSTLLPLRSSVSFCFEPRTRQDGRRTGHGGLLSEVEAPKLSPSSAFLDLSREERTMQIESECFIMQG